MRTDSPLAKSEQVFDTREMATGHARNLAVDTLDGAHQAARRAQLELVAEPRDRVCRPVAAFFES